MKRALYKIKERLIVSKCPSCGEITKYSGTLCDECRAGYTKEASSPCKFCALPARECVCSTRGLYFCRECNSSDNVVFSALLKNLKYSPDRGCEKFFSRELAREILMMFAKSGQLSQDWCVTFPPRRRSAVSQYGFDQSKGVARRLARYTGAHFESVFRRRGKTAQKTLDALSREENAKRAFALSGKADVRGKKYIIVDDVITSGATMKTCQTLLLSHGAKCAFALTLSKTPMRGAGYDERRPFRKRSTKAWFNS